MVLVILLLLSLSYLTSISKIDSLETLLINSRGKQRINLLNQLSSIYRNKDNKIGFDYAKLALTLAEQEKYKAGEAHAYNNLGHFYMKSYNYESAQQNFQNALDMFDKLKMEYYIGNATENIGHVYWYKGDFSNCLEHYKRTLEIYLHLKDEMRQAKASNNLGQVYYRLGFYDESLKYFLQAMRLKEKLHNPTLHHTLNNLGIVYLKLSDYDNALDMYKRTLQIRQERNIDTASTLSNIGTVYLTLQDYDKAMHYFSEALILNRKQQNKKSISVCLNNIAIVMEETGNIEQALENYKEALAIKRNISDTYGYSNTAKNIGSLFLIKNDMEQADKYLRESLMIAQENEARDIIKENYLLISKFYAKQNDFANAYKYLNFYSDIKDSLFNKEINDKINQHRTSFEMEKTLNDKELLLKDNQIFKLQLQKNKSSRVILFLMLFILIMIAVSLYYYYSKVNKLNTILSGTNETLESKVKQRTSELKDANENLREEVNERKKTGEHLKASLKEKEVMLNEIHHRVKNNLQVINSILNIQSRSSLSTDSINILTNTSNWLYSMSLVQEQVYTSDNLELVDFNLYVRSLTENIFNSMQVSHAKIKTVFNIQDIKLNVNLAIPCGLLINEIIINAIKHSFKKGGGGKIIINMNQENSFIYLEVCNDGESIPEKINYLEPNTAGLEIIRILALQLSAKMEIINHNGVTYKLKFKNK